MKAYEIKLSDIQRMLIGEVPFQFYLEVILRIAIIYLILMVSMRLMGKRMSSQLSRNEMAAVASLAAAVGIPLMNPDRGLLPALVVAIVIICYQVFIASKASVNKKFESLTQDKYNMLVKDGVLNFKAMQLTRISRDRVFSQLRSEMISQLGMVKRLYFEADGTFSLLKAVNPQPGLSVIPEWDHELNSALNQQVAAQVCQHCGNMYIEAGSSSRCCLNCGSEKWVPAVKNTT